MSLQWQTIEEGNDGLNVWFWDRRIRELGHGRNLVDG